ncbi:MAG: type VI secretion system tip protein TssI/VgrG [Myxococcota bacterium]
MEPEEYLGQAALLTLNGLSTPRLVHGMIERFELLLIGRRFTHYRAVLVPSIAPLQLRQQSRIFQQLSTPDIVQKVLKEAGIPGDGIELLLEGQYPARDYCVQYQESDLRFISRLLEEEGIFYYFRHEPDRDVMVLGDDPQSLGGLEAPSVVTFRDESRSTALQEEHLFLLQSSARLRAGTFSLKDYKFVQPNLDLNATHSGELSPELEVYTWPGEYVDPALGQRLARVRAEEALAQRHQLRAVGTCRFLQPGHVFTVIYHPRADFNRPYLPLHLHHEAEQPGVLEEEEGTEQRLQTRYRCQLRLISAETVFRPPRVTPRPVIPGVQSAFVVGPGGEEIYTDAHGRVKVQFHWDRQGKRNEQSSCWIRVSHPWAGAGFGAVFLPRVGQEVLVQFLEGDPDRPVLVGRVFNGATPHPYALPSDKTISTLKTRSSPGGKGFNELRFEDKSGKEEVFLHAQRDFNELIRANHARQVGGHSDTTVKKHIRLRSTSDAIYLSAPKKIVMTVGKSKLVLTPDKVILTSPEIWSVAEGQNHLKGGVVKLNCAGSPPQDGEEGTASGVALKSGASSSATPGADATSSTVSTAAKSATTTAASEGLGANVLKTLGSLAEKVDVVGYLNKLKTSNAFLDYLRTAAIPGATAFQNTLVTALKEGRLPTGEELKAAGVEALSGGVSEVLGKAVSEHLPDDWPAEARTALVDLIKSSSKSAVSTAVLTPTEMDTWAETFKSDATKTAGKVFGAFAEREVQAYLKRHASSDPNLAEETLQTALPGAVGGLVREGVPVLLGKLF